jgi:sec-independent protein translocase protein TatA
MPGRAGIPAVEDDMPFNLGPMEMVFVMVVLLLLFGAKRLPELGSGLGKGIREFKRTMSDVNAEISAPAAPTAIPPQGAWAHVQAPAQPSPAVAPVSQAPPDATGDRAQS